MPSFPASASQKLTNLAPNIPCTRLPIHKLGTCARVVWRGWLAAKPASFGMFGVEIHDYIEEVQG